MSVVVVNQDNFKEEVLGSDIPVLVDFYAEWCGPCKMLAPIIDQVSSENEGKLKVCKLDIDQAQALASEYGVMSVPTMIFFKGGEKVNQAVGAIPKDKIDTLVGEVI